MLIVLLAAAGVVAWMQWGNGINTPITTEAPDTTEVTITTTVPDTTEVPITTDTPNSTGMPVTTKTPETTTVPTDINAPGLYDANDNLLVTWDELVNTFGMRVDKDYTNVTRQKDKSSPYYVFTHTSELKNGKRLVLGKVDRIGNYAFCSCKTLESITIPDSVTTIGYGAFAYCYGLTSVTIGSGTTSIEQDAFYFCKHLTSITFNGTVDEWDEISKGSLWKHNVPATEVVCTDGVVTIE